MTCKLWLTRALIMAALIPASAARAENGPSDEAPRAGYWETVNTWVFLIPFRKVERKCFTTTDISSFLEGPSNAHYTCTYPVREVGDGRLSVEGTCVEKRGQVAQIKARGMYGPTAFHLTAELRTKIAGVPLNASGVTDARRLGDVCPAPAAKR
jgi:hypothetical protein